MSYTRKERDAAILLIGLNSADVKNLSLYEDLQKFGWVVISKVDGLAENIRLTFWGTDLFNRLLKNEEIHIEQ